MRILYLHGLYSKPGGVKPTFLAGLGHDVVNPHLPDEDFAESVRRAREAFDSMRPDAVVGSSRGGAVALHVDTGDIPVVLIAPAWRRWGHADRASPATTILHSRRDEVIPFEDSLELIARSGLPPESLIEVGADHAMIDASAFDALADALRRVAGRHDD